MSTFRLLTIAAFVPLVAALAVVIPPKHRSSSAAGAFGDPAWRPAADIYRTPTGWLVKFDLAGVRPEDVEVFTYERRLTVRGTRRDCCVEESCHAYHMEIAYSRFERSIELPCRLEDAGIDAAFREGMLLVQVREVRP